MVTPPPHREDSQIMQRDLPSGRVRLHHHSYVPLGSNRFPRVYQGFEERRKEAIKDLDDGGGG